MTGDRAPAEPRWLRTGAGFVTVEVIAKPSSARGGVIRVEERGVVIGLGSPAHEGRANAELIDAVAALSGVPRSAVSIIRGAGTRSKVIRIETPSPRDVVKTFASLANR